MHELGIIVHISKSLEELAKENDLSEIESVTLEIGEVSGVVNEYLTDCWEYYRKKDKLIENTEMIIEMIPGVTYCESCKKTYPTVQYGRECPHCHSGETYLVQGNECNIKEISAC